MIDIAEVIQATGIGLLVATFLLNTGRALKAIEICKECLIFLNTKALGKEMQFDTLVYSAIYDTMFIAYCVIPDYTNAIKYARELLVSCHECDETVKEGNIAIKLAKIYENHCKYAEARELYEKAINIMKETGDRKGEVYAYVGYGVMSLHLGQHVKAKKYLKKALAIAIATGDKTGQASCYGNLGTVFKCLSELEKAKEYLEKSLVITIDIGDRKGEASCYGNLGTVFKSLGEYDKAKEYHERALAIKIEIGDRDGEAIAYANLGTVFQSLGEYDKAKEFCEKSLAIKIKNGDRGRKAQINGILGTVHLSLGEYDKAKEYVEKALAIRIDIGDKAGEAADYGNLGMVFNFFGKYDKAKEYLERALLIRIEIGDREGEATDYSNLGTLFLSINEYDRAQEYLEKALAIRIVIGDRAGEAVDYGNLGTLFQSLGKYDKAKEYHEKALVIRIQIGEKRGEASSYGNLGTAFRSLGEYDKAREYHEKALAIRIEIGDREGEARSYGDLGSVFQSLGEYDRAREYQEKALGIEIEIGDREGLAASYGNLGNLFHSLGEYDIAKEHYEKALAISSEIGNRSDEGKAYENLGGVLNSRGEYDKAKNYLEKAITIKIEIGDRAGEGSCYVNLGNVLKELGEYEKAKDFFKKSLTISMEIGDRDGEAANYNNLGTLFHHLGEHVRAEVYLEKALSISTDVGNVEYEIECCFDLTLVKYSQEKIQEAFYYLILGMKKSENLRGFLRDNDQFKVAFSDKYDFPYRELSAFFCFSRHANKALYLLELSRARALGDLMATRYSVEKQNSVNPQSWIGIENIMKRESRCDCLYISYHGQDVFLWILKASGVIYFRRITVNENIIGAELVSSLDHFLSKIYRSFGILSPRDCEDRSLNGIEQKPNVSQEEILADVRLVEDDGDDDEGNQDPEPSLPLLYKMLIAPVADLLGEPEIIIVPDRSLYQVPFAALADEGGKYLSETSRIRTVPSLTALKLIQDSPADYHSQTGALIVGDPVVGRVRYMGCRTTFNPLPCARKEAEMIGRLLGVQPLLGEHATKTAVLQAINSVTLIHFAAHGNAERGEIALSPVCTTTRIPQDDDYLLTMSDISQVRLRAKLVVLSCCHSGCGQIRAEGVVGIARAFLGSGARSVLVALWAIEDRATEQFMKCFYEHLVRGESASESLHETMKWMRDNGFAKVSEWAPFMLIGDNVTFDLEKLKKAGEFESDST